MMEVWKDVIGYEGLYEVSNLGRIKSLPRRLRGNNGFRYSREKILKEVPHTSGYVSVVLCKNGIHKTTLVHRIVAEAFLENKENLLEVNHKNENKKDNRVENLEWCTRSYNVNYGSGIERKAKATGKKVCQYDMCGHFIRSFDSITEAARFVGGRKAPISHCCSGRTNSSYGYKWKLKTE